MNTAQFVALELERVESDKPITVNVARIILISERDSSSGPVARLVLTDSQAVEVKGTKAKIVEKIKAAVADSEVEKLRKESEEPQLEPEGARTQAEGAVVWAIRRQSEPACLWKNHLGSVALFATRSDVLGFLRGMQPTDWEPVPYPLGAGADEMKAELERRDKAAFEAQEKANEAIAAWQEAADSHRHPHEVTPHPRTPEKLAKRFEMLSNWIQGLSEHDARLEQQLETLRAELAGWKEAANYQLASAYIVEPEHLKQRIDALKEVEGRRREDVRRLEADEKACKQKPEDSKIRIDDFIERISQLQERTDKAEAEAISWRNAANYEWEPNDIDSPQSLQRRIASLVVFDSNIRKDEDDKLRAELGEWKKAASVRSILTPGDLAEYLKFDARQVAELNRRINILLGSVSKLKAELEVDKAALKDMTEKRDKTTTELCAWVSAARHGLIYGDGMIEIESPEDLEKRIDHLTDQIRIRAESLEEVQAELAAERARPRGGVAWALRSRKTRELNRLCLQKTVILYKSKADAERAAKDCGTEWEVITYPLGDGADELKAAIAAKEKAEAEVAAWKAAPDLLSALEACLALIEAEIPFPEIDHICGSPDACCDGDCMDAAYLSKVRSDAFFAIRKAKGLAPYG